jgi:hypothetical protein
MGIWIRSQDKKMLSYGQAVWVEGEDVYTDSNSKYWSFFTIGKYSTKERALQVLDAIQRFTETQALARFYGTSEGSLGGEDLVFQMPAE